MVKLRVRLIIVEVITMWCRITHLFYDSLQPPLWTHEGDGSDDFGMEHPQSPVLHTPDKTVTFTITHTIPYKNQ